jgi:hypothetical protein
MAKDKEFLEKWKKTPQEHKENIRATILEEAAEFLNRKAFEDFGMQRGSVSMELSKLILIARDCLEKQEKK